MPNLKPPVTTAAQVVAYRPHSPALPQASTSRAADDALLTDNTSPTGSARAREAGVVAVKLYPAGATTSSDAGVTDIRKTHATLEMMQREDRCC